MITFISPWEHPCTFGKCKHGVSEVDAVYPNEYTYTITNYRFTYSDGHVEQVAASSTNKENVFAYKLRKAVETYQNSSKYGVTTHAKLFKSRNAHPVVRTNDQRNADIAAHEEWLETYSNIPNGGDFMYSDGKNMWAYKVEVGTIRYSDPVQVTIAVYLTGLCGIFQPVQYEWDPNINKYPISGGMHKKVAEETWTLLDGDGNTISSTNDNKSIHQWFMDYQWAECTNNCTPPVIEIATVAQNTYGDSAFIGISIRLQPSGPYGFRTNSEYYVPVQVGWWSNWWTGLYALIDVFRFNVSGQGQDTGTPIGNGYWDWSAIGNGLVHSLYHTYTNPALGSNNSDSSSSGDASWDYYGGPIVESWNYQDSCEPGFCPDGEATCTYSYYGETVQEYPATPRQSNSSWSKISKIGFSYSGDLPITASYTDSYQSSGSCSHTVSPNCSRQINGSFRIWGDGNHCDAESISHSDTGWVGGSSSECIISNSNSSNTVFTLGAMTSTISHSYSGVATKYCSAACRELSSCSTSAPCGFDEHGYPVFGGGSSMGRYLHSGKGGIWVTYASKAECKSDQNIKCKLVTDDGYSYSWEYDTSTDDHEDHFFATYDSRIRKHFFTERKASKIYNISLNPWILIAYCV